MWAYSLFITAQQKPIRTIVKKIQGEFLVYKITNLPRKYQEIINTIKEGHYKTRYDLYKYFGGGTVSSFIKLGIEQGFLKQETKLVGSRIKKILQLVY